MSIRWQISFNKRHHYFISRKKLIFFVPQVRQIGVIDQLINLYDFASKQICRNSILGVPIEKKHVKGGCGLAFLFLKVEPNLTY